MKTSWMLALEGLQALDVLRVLGPERIEHRLVAAGGVHPPLDAEPLDQAVEAEARRTTPIEPTIEDGSAKISSPAQAIM